MHQDTVSAVCCHVSAVVWGQHLDCIGQTCCLVVDFLDDLSQRICDLSSMNCVPDVSYFVNMRRVFNGLPAEMQ